MKYLSKEIEIAPKLENILRNMPLQFGFNYFIEIIGTKSDKVEYLYSFYARSPNEV